MSERVLPHAWEELAPVVPMPAVYLDVVMPFLTDAEWRVLCIIIRQTLGWTAPGSSGERKRRDWISQSQFRERTGKSRDSISRAVAGLLRHNLIAIENRRGELLSSPRQRLLSRDRLYYRLVPPRRDSTAHQ
ncbi:replication protein [Armatimonas sp.]|uniref:replication protein n=1 Tax=Armatimonas sp. TaxID=1872638 RepID=UPI00374D1ECA